MQASACSPAHGVRTRFLIADDHEIFGEMLRAFLEKSYSVVGVVQDGHAMVETALRLKPDVIIADIGMPMMNGLDAARAILEKLPNLKFIFLTMQNDPNL